MAKQTINIGQTANDRSGDPLRTAFNKVNENFTELYAAVQEGINVDQVQSDWNAVSGLGVILNKPTIPTDVSDLSDTTGLLDGGVNLAAVNQSIIPDTDVTYDLGSPTNRFKDLYLSGSTIYLGESTITTTAGGGIATPVDRGLGGWGVSYPDTGGSAGTYTLNFARTPGSTVYIHGGWQDPNYGGPGVPGPGGTFDWVEGDGNFTVDGKTLVITNNQQYQVMNCWEVYTLSGDSITATTLTGDTVATTSISFPDVTFRIVAVPTTSKGASGDAAGDMAFDGTHFYYCTAAYTDGLSDIWKRVAWSGDTW